MRKLPHTRSCFVCGLHNPHGLKLDFETDGRIVQARFTPRQELAGFRSTVHGGILSTVLDEMMVWACGVQTRRFTYCAELNVRFLKPVQPGEDLLVVGEMTANRRDRILEARAEIRNAAGEKATEATGKYVPIKGDILQELLADFVESTEDLFGGQPPPGNA